MILYNNCNNNAYTVYTGCDCDCIVNTKYCDQDWYQHWHGPCTNDGEVIMIIIYPKV